MSRAQRFVIVADTHGDHIDPEVRDSFFSAMKDFRPDVVIHAGDLFNFDYLRRGASLGDENASASADWEAGVSFFKELFSYGSQRFYLQGNHCARLEQTFHSTTKEAVRLHAAQGIRDIENMVRKHKVHMKPYDSRVGVLDLNGLRVLHGFACGVGAARKLAQVYGDCCYGHTHSLDTVTVEKWPEPVTAMGTGCLMTLDPHYNKHMIGKLKHQQGWVQGIIVNGKAFPFAVKKQSDGKFYAAQDYKAY